MQEFEYVDNRRAFRFAGILLFVLVLLAIYLMFSGTGITPDPGRPDIRLPKIGAIPAEGVPKLQHIDSERETHPADTRAP